MGLPANTDSHDNIAAGQNRLADDFPESAFQRPPKKKRGLIRSFTKWAFPGDTRSQRRKKIKFLMVAAGVGITLGILVILFEWMKSF